MRRKNEQEGTSWEDLLRYMRNDLPKERMSEVERSIRRNGEAETVYHNMMFNYHYNRSYADALIGVDEEEFEKNRDENRGNLENESLKKKQTKITHLKNEDVMKTVEELNGAKNVKNVQNAVEALRPDIERMMQAEPKDFQRYGVQVLMERYEINEDAARKIVDELLAGIHEFDEQYKALQQGENRVEKLLDSKTDEEKKNLLVQSLAALEVLKTSEDLAEAGDLQEAIAKYESMPYEELLALFTQKINEGECFDEIVQRMEGVRTLNKEEMEKLRTFLKEHGEAYKFYVALALYMGHCDQKIDLSAGEEVNPKMIGASAAAAVTITQISAENVDEPTWRRWMKFVFGALYYVSVAVAGMFLSVSVGVMIVTGLMLMFGQGIIAAILAIAVGVSVSIMLTNKVMEFVDWSVDALEKPYDWVVDKLVEWCQKLKVIWEKKMRPAQAEEAKEPGATTSNATQEATESEPRETREQASASSSEPTVVTPPVQTLNPFAFS